jgi:dTDP-4-amino-4,6-dideoxygalactose transaminase
MNNAEELQEGICQRLRKIILPLWDSSNNHVFHLFVIRTENRQELQNYLLKMEYRP